MGDSHYTSNIVGTGATTIKGFASVTATALNGPATGNHVVNAGGYLKLGAHQYVMFGTLNVEASIVAAATAVDASCKGSLYINSDGSGMWYFDSDSAATNVTLR